MKNVSLELLDEKDTERLAAAAAEILSNGGTIFLSGSLGAGKTAFVRYFVRKLDILTPVSSPTYVLHHEYAEAGKARVNHWDLYRLSSLPDEILEPVKPGEILIVEWADKFPELDGRADLTVLFNPVSSETRREVVLTGPSAESVSRHFAKTPRG